MGRRRVANCWTYNIRNTLHVCNIFVAFFVKVYCYLRIRVSAYWTAALYSTNTRHVIFCSIVGGVVWVVITPEALTR